MERILQDGETYIYFEYSKEEEFEKDIIEHSYDIFGLRSVYIDVKKRIGEDKIISIPDGYLIDFTFENNPQLYIIENELVVHDPFKHIGQQLLRFAISYKASGRKIKKYLLDSLSKDNAKRKIVEEGFKKAEYGNIDNFLEDIIFEKPVAAIVIIDQITTDLENVLSQLKMQTDIVEFQTFINKDMHIHKYTPFHQDIMGISGLERAEIKAENLDTIVVPANEDGFNEVFLGQNCWYSIRISSAMIDRIKYIAGYQTAPISAITYYAEVQNIERYKDTGRYIVYFKDKAKPIGPINIPDDKRNLAPQSSRYTTIERLMKARTLKDIF